MGVLCSWTRQTYTVISRLSLHFELEPLAHTLLILLSRHFWFDESPRETDETWGNLPRPKNERFLKDRWRKQQRIVCCCNTVGY